MDGAAPRHRPSSAFGVSAKQRGSVAPFFYFLGEK